MRGGTPRVLVVDDRRENLLAVEAILDDLPIDIHTVDSGERALKQVLTEDYAVILLDAHMPDMDGFETAAVIKQRERSRNIPIVFLTAGADEPDLVARGYQLGAVDYLTKPFHPWMLRSKVTVFADLWRAQAELQEVNARLQAQTEDLVRSNRDLEQFAYAASHDLQEPLRKVISFCELLGTRYREQLDERGMTYIDFAVDGARRMSALISDLLAFSRVGRTTTKQSFEPVAGADLLEQALRNLGPAIEESGARVTHDPLPEVFGEATLLTAVLQNLVGNAVKFRGEEPPRVHVGVRRESDHWVFRVTDNGIGIDPAYADKIFVIFQRLHAKDAYPGTGIGLSLCRKIVEYHGGRIWLDQEVSAGTVICFTLPAAPGGADDTADGTVDDTVVGTDDDPADEGDS